MPSTTETPSAPRTVAIIGAGGQIAGHLADLLVARGDRVRGIIHSPSHADDLEARGVTPAVVDLEADTAEHDLTRALEGADAAVFAAGAGPGSSAERKLTVDYGGAVHTAAACAASGTNRLVVISSIGTDDPPQDDDTMSVYLRAKASADDHVRASGLDYTIVRPVSLTDDAGTGQVQAARHLDEGEIPRADVAAVLLATLDNDATIGRTFEVAAGDSDVTRAVASAAAEPATVDA